MTAAESEARNIVELACSHNISIEASIEAHGNRPVLTEEERQCVAMNYHFSLDEIRINFPDQPITHY